MSAYAKEIKKIIVGIQAHDQEKVEKLDEMLTKIAVEGSSEDIDASLHEVEKFLFEELLNYDMVSKAKSA